MFKLSVVKEDALPKSVGWALVEAVDGRLFGFVKQSQLHAADLPMVFRAELAHRAGLEIRRAS